MNQKTIITILVVVVVILLGTTIYFATVSNTSQPAQTPLVKQQATQSPATTPVQTNNTATTVPSDWKTYSDQKYGYQLQYPSNWNLASDNGSDSDGYNVTVWQGDGFNKDNIQIVKVMYGTNADGTVSNREIYLKMLTNGSHSNISVAGGQGYYSVNETKGGPSPTIYLVGDKEIFLMNFNIFDSKKTPLSEAEKLFKQVIGTFKFTK